MKKPIEQKRPNFMPPYMGERINLVLGKKKWKFPMLELAKRTGYSRKELYNYIDDGKIMDVVMLKDICRALDVSADYLLFGDGKDDVKEKELLSKRPRIKDRYELIRASDIADYKEGDTVADK